MIKHLTPRSKKEIDDYFNNYQFCDEVKKFSFPNKEMAIDMDRRIRYMKLQGIWEKLDSFYHFSSSPLVNWKKPNEN